MGDGNLEGRARLPEARSSKRRTEQRVSVGEVQVEPRLLAVHRHGRALHPLPRHGERSRARLLVKLIDIAASTFCWYSLGCTRVF